MSDYSYSDNHSQSTAISVTCTAGVPIGLSPPCILPLPPWPITLCFPFLSLGRLCGGQGGGGGWRASKSQESLFKMPCRRQQTFFWFRWVGGLALRAGSARSPSSASTAPPPPPPVCQLQRKKKGVKLKDRPELSGHIKNSFSGGGGVRDYFCKLVAFDKNTLQHQWEASVDLNQQCWASKYTATKLNVTSLDCDHRSPE